jgi:hypothetical protein
MTILGYRISRLLVFATISVTVAAPGARAQAHFYASVAGADTMSLERFERAGTTITGVWVTYHFGADRHRDILRHEYTMTLGENNRPVAVHIVLRRPDSEPMETYDARFTDDSAIVTITPDTLPPRRIAARRGYPLLGSTMSMYGLFVESAGSANTGEPGDSVRVVGVPVTGPFAARSALVTRVRPNVFRLDPGGSMFFIASQAVVDSIVPRDGSVQIRQVGAFDIDAVARAAAKGR